MGPGGPDVPDDGDRGAVPVTHRPSSLRVTRRSLRR